jgi:hypothetical protein
VYATGDWSMTQLHRELTARGLTTRATPRRASKPIRLSSLQRILTNPYYKGDITYHGVTYRGQYTPIVPVEVWAQVQTVLGMHTTAADASQIHDHYLKCSVFCGQCGHRLLITHARNKYGKIYPYVVCAGRQRNRDSCSRQAMPISRVEQLVEDHYRHVQITPGVRQAVSGMILAEFDRLINDRSDELARLTGNRDRLHHEQTKLMEAHYADAVPLELLRSE